MKKNQQKKKMTFLKKKIQTGLLFIKTTRNNTIITLTDKKGNTIFWRSSGTLGFQNSRKSTTYAAQATAEKVVQDIISKGYSSVDVKLKGLGRGKQSALRALYKSGLQITRIQDTTPLPHNGCRTPKKRRI